MNKSNRVITYDNYYSNTFAIFKACKKPKREPNYISSSDSVYWYGENKRGKYVIRCSDHWTRENHGKRDCRRIASCQWEIIGKDLHSYSSFSFMTGKCYLSTFVPIQ